MAVEERLRELRRRIDRLEATTHDGAADGSLPLRRQLAALRRDEASTRTSIHRATGAVEDRLEQLGNEIDIAEHGLAAQLADDRHAFAEAVEAGAARLGRRARAQAGEGGAHRGSGVRPARGRHRRHAAAENRCGDGARRSAQRPAARLA